MKTNKIQPAQNVKASLGCKLPLPENETQCQQRLRRLKMLKNMLLHHDEIFGPQSVAFNLRYWYITGENITNRTRGCGTAACALGSAMLLEEFQKEGLKPSAMSTSTNVFGAFSTVPKLDGVTFDSSIAGFNEGAAFFHISFDESVHLFSPEKYRYEDSASQITPEMVADRVQQLMDKYAPGCPEYQHSNQ